MTTPQEPFQRTGDPEIDHGLAQLAAQMAGLEEVGRQLGEVSGHGEGADGQVVVKVLPSGSLASVRIDPRALRLGSEALAEAIMTAARQAEDDAVDQASALTQSLLDEDGPRSGRDRP